MSNDVFTPYAFKVLVDHNFDDAHYTKTLAIINDELLLDGGKKIPQSDVLEITLGYVDEDNNWKSLSPSMMDTPWRSSLLVPTITTSSGAGEVIQ